jgi:hypothetical protein
MLSIIIFLLRGGPAEIALSQVRVSNGLPRLSGESFFCFEVIYYCIDACGFVCDSSCLRIANLVETGG